MSFIYWLFDGRPMAHLSLAFIDQVNLRPVYRFVDGHGRRWLAHGAWSIFRVKQKETR